MQPQIKKKVQVERRKRGETEAGSRGAGGRGGHPGGRCPSDLQAEPSLSPAACNPSQGPKLRGGGRGRASLLQVNPFPECRNMKNQKKEKMVEKRRVSRITVYLWSRLGFWVGGADWCLATIGRAQRLVGRRASFDHASLYLGCSPEVKVLLVEVFIVPVFSLMSDITERI